MYSNLLQIRMVSFYVGFFFNISPITNLHLTNQVTHQEKQIIYIMFTSYNCTLILSRCKSLLFF